MLRNLALALALCGCGGQALGEDAEAEEEDTGPPGECVPWPDGPRAEGRGSQLPVRFVDASEELGLASVPGGYPGIYAGEWPRLCPLEGEGNITRPCAQALQAGGAAAEDLDGDGDLDLVVAVLEGRDLWLRNRLDEGVVGFEPWADVVRFSPALGADATPYADWASSGVALADIDGDEDLDAIFSSIGQPFRVLENLGDETPHFEWRPSAIDQGGAVDGSFPPYGYSIGVGDYDRDGWLDVYTSDWRSSARIDTSTVHARLFRNQGEGAPPTARFADVSLAAGAGALGDNPGGIWVFAPSFVDLDDDGWSDLAVVADNHSSKLLFNEGDGSFVDETWRAGVNLERSGMGSTFGDFDGDGHLDWYVTAIHDIGTETCPDGVCVSGNRLYMNRGHRCFEDVAFATQTHEGAWGWGAAAFDMDNDGDLDLVETNGFRSPFGRPGMFFDDRPMRAWLQVGRDVDDAGRVRPRFADVGVATGLAAERGQGRGLLTFDYDGDGDLDLLIVQNGGPLRLLRNDGGEQNCSLRVRVRGRAPNVHGIHARVRVRRDDADGWQVREIGVRQGFLGQSPNIAHFGLGPESDLAGGRVAEVRVRFAGAAEEVVVEGVGCGELVVAAP